MWREGEAGVDGRNDFGGRERKDEWRDEETRRRIYLSGMEVMRREEGDTCDNYLGI